MKKNSMFDLHSALQKAIRRGDEREALRAAWQLDMVANDKKYTSKRTGGQMWSIIRRICAEDIGLANPSILQAIETLWHFWQKQTESSRNIHEPWRLFTVEAVMLLCASPKSRRVDHACIVIHPTRLRLIVEELKLIPQPHPIPEYTHDGLHTGRGRGSQAEFIKKEDAALSPKMDLDDPYKQEIIAALT